MFLSRYFPVFLFGMLLLLAPCSMRNHIESLAGLDKTEVLNKSKAALQETTPKVFCNADNLTIDTTRSHRETQGNHSLIVGYLDSQSVSAPVTFAVTHFNEKTPELVPENPDPLYLLYGNLKLGEPAV